MAHSDWCQSRWKLLGGPAQPWSAWSCCFGMVLYTPDWPPTEGLVINRGGIDFLSSEPTRCLRHLLAASWQTLMPANQQLTWTDANALCWRGWVTQAQIDAGCSTTWAPLYCHHISCVWYMSTFPLAVGLNIQDANRKSTQTIKAGYYMYHCRKAFVTGTKWSLSQLSIMLLPDQHSLSVVISVCRKTTSLSSFPSAVTCSELGLTASCPHHQFRQCRVLRRGETWRQECGEQEKKWCNIFFNSHKIKQTKKLIWTFFGSSSGTGVGMCRQALVWAHAQAFIADFISQRKCRPYRSRSH